MPAINYSLRIIKGYPTPNVQFIDINTLLAEPEFFTQVIDKMCQTVQQTLPPDVLSKTAIITPESRGFFFAAPVAYRLGLPFLPIRKKGKIPNKPYRFRITNEYDSYDMEVDEELLLSFPNFIYIDDILATGQTLASVRKAMAAKGKEILLAVHLTSVKSLQTMRDDNPELKNLPLKEIL